MWDLLLRYQVWGGAVEGQLGVSGGPAVPRLRQGALRVVRSSVRDEPGSSGWGAVARAL